MQLACQTFGSQIDCHLFRKGGRNFGKGRIFHRWVAYFADAVAGCHGCGIPHYLAMLWAGTPIPDCWDSRWQRLWVTAGVGYCDVESDRFQGLGSRLGIFGASSVLSIYVFPWVHVGFETVDTRRRAGKTRAVHWERSCSLLWKRRPEGGHASVLGIGFAESLSVFKSPLAISTARRCGGGFAWSGCDLLLVGRPVGEGASSRSIQGDRIHAQQSVFSFDASGREIDCGLDRN